VIGQRALRLLFSPETNLSPAARVLVAHVGTLKESTEIDYSTLGRLFHMRDRRIIRAVVDEAADARWVAVEKRHGRGLHPLFSFIGPPEKEPEEENGAQNVPFYGENGAQNVPYTEVNGAQNVPFIDDVARAFLIGSSNEEEEGEDARVRAREAAEEKMKNHPELLGPVAEPLREYLERRVPPDRWVPYIGSVASLLRPMTTFDWRAKGGAEIPLEKRGGYVVDALLDLGASDEERGHRRPTGDFGNLKTKIQVLINPHQKSDADRGAGNAKRGRFAAAAGTGARRAAHRGQQAIEE
jgi:hypothetical protein